MDEPALSYGRLYFREVSGDDQNFGLSHGRGGIIAFSRVLAGAEVVIVANTSAAQPWKGSVLVNYEINQHSRQNTVAYSNLQGRSE